MVTDCPHEIVDITTLSSLSREGLCIHCRARFIADGEHDQWSLRPTFLAIDQDRRMAPQ